MKSPAAGTHPFLFHSFHPHMSAVIVPVIAAGAYVYNRCTMPQDISIAAFHRCLATFIESYISHPVPEGSRKAIRGEECVVCRCDLPYFPKDPPSATCAHVSQVCQDCLKRVIQMAVSSGNFTEDCNGIRCPSLTCEAAMGYSDIQKWADQADFQRYDRAVVTNAMMGEPNFVRCLNSRCNAGQIHAGGDENPIVVCYACGTKQCRLHEMAWHTGYTCKQWDKLHKKNKKKEERSADAIKSLTKACPAPNCGRRIQKAQGCDHMTCQRPGGCGFQFCWLCLAPWEPIKRQDNSKHYDNCRYYSGMSGANPSPFIVMEPKKGWSGWWKKAS